MSSTHKFTNRIQYQFIFKTSPWVEEEEKKKRHLLSLLFLVSDQHPIHYILCLEIHNLSLVLGRHRLLLDSVLQKRFMQTGFYKLTLSHKAEENQVDYFLGISLFLHKNLTILFTSVWITILTDVILVVSILNRENNVTRAILIIVCGFFFSLPLFLSLQLPMKISSILN